MITPNPNTEPTVEQKQILIDLLQSGVSSIEIFCFHYFPLEWAIIIEGKLKEVVIVDDTLPQEEQIQIPIETIIQGILDNNIHPIIVIEDNNIYPVIEE